MGARKVGGPEGWGPDLEKVRAPRVFALFLSLSGGLLVEFWCLKRGGTLKRARLEHSPRAKSAHLTVPEFKKHHQNSTRRPPRERPKERQWGREREKKARNFGRSGGGGAAEGSGAGKWGSGGGVSGGWGPAEEMKKIQKI